MSDNHALCTTATEPSSQPLRLVLVGVGNVGRRFLELLLRQQELLGQKLGLAFTVVGVADSSGVAACPSGLDLAKIIELKLAGRGVADYPLWGETGTPALDLVQNAQADLLLDASPGNLETGQPGLACIEAALSRGMHAVLANKSPLVLAFQRLWDMARSHGVQLRFDATVTGGLPAVNLGQRDLAIAHVERLEGILNLTTNYILTRIADDGLSYEQALAEAQATGHAETNPSLDVDGWDAAAKLVILAHSVLDCPARLEDVTVEGIGRLSAEDLSRARATGKRIKLLAVAEHERKVGAPGVGQGPMTQHPSALAYRLHVRPTLLDTTHPLACLGAEQMGIVFYTDICGVIAAAIVEETPVPTAAAMLRDVVAIYRD